MQNWFCGAICGAESQDKNQLILLNNQTEEVFAYSHALLYQNQKSNTTGFTMMIKSLYEQHVKECRTQKKSFTDKAFSPTAKSLGFSNDILSINFRNKPIIWKRIPELYQNCQLIQGKIQPADIQQGNIGDCYFLAAISALAQEPNNILKIFQKPNIQAMVKNQYGIYKLVVNVGGQPKQVVVDDYMPVFAKSQRPVFCKPVNNEFWVVLIEKVWAKVNGSYANIIAGNPHEVLNKFCVAPVFFHNINEKYYQEGHRQNKKEVQQFEKNLWSSIMQGHKQNFPMCCGSRSNIYVEGIKQKHSYTLLAAYQFLKSEKKYKVVKLRNPWGDTQYQGYLSEYDPIWNTVDPTLKKQAFKRRQNDGIFLLPYNQFLINFESIDICHCKSGYNYIFYPVEFENESCKKFYRLVVKEEGEVYLTYQKNYQKNYQQKAYLSSGVSKIFVATQIDHNQYEYLDSALETTLADVSLRCKKLNPGVYIVMVEREAERKYNTGLKSSHTVSTYSNVSCFLSEIPPAKNYLHEFFLSHSIKYNLEKKRLNPSLENDYIAHKLLSSCGYGYIVISLNENGKKKIEININRKKVYEDGYKLQLPSNVKFYIRNDDSNLIWAEIVPGTVAVFIFQIDFQKEGHLNLSFPPSGLQIKKVI